MTQLSTNLLSSLPFIPEDPVYGLQEVIKNDSRSEKLNLSIGVLPNFANFAKVNGTVATFSSVEQAATLVGIPPQGYLPLTGHAHTNALITKLLFGEHASHCVTSQTIGGTGAVHMLLHLFQRAGIKYVATQTPTWINHPKIIEALGLQFIGLDSYAPEQLEQLPPATLLLLQPTCHNPLGTRLSDTALHSIFQITEALKIPLLFDIAYLGFGRSLYDDTAAIRLALEYDQTIAVALSGSKSFGLYNSRIGWASVLTTQATKALVKRNFEFCARTHYSSPPSYGAFVVEKLLSDAVLTQQWAQELESVRNRLTYLRKSLCQLLEGKYGADPSGEGLFMLLHLSYEEVQKLQTKFAIYVGQEGMMTGRINLFAIHDIERLCYAINEVKKK